MSFSRTQQSTVRTSPTRFPPHWSRKLSDRTGGLYKKANTLFHLERAKVAVLVSSGGYFHGYLSHGPADWPELHQLATSNGIALTTPDDLDTVSQRYAGRSQSIASTESSSTMTSGCEQDPIMQLLSTLEEEPEAFASASLPATTSGASASLLGSGRNPSITVWTPPSTPERAPKASEMKVPTALMSTEPAFDSHRATNTRCSQSVSTGLPTICGPSTPDHAVETPDRKLGVMDSRVHKKRVVGSGKSTRGVTTRSHGSRGSKGRR